MVDIKSLTPPKAAIKFIHAVDAFYAVHTGDKFPIDVDQLALEAANLFQWGDPVTKIQPLNNIQGFDGMLASNKDKTKWMIAYNESVLSPGRIRFTKAHELGHYVLHRYIRDEFMCSKDDMLDWENAQNIEAQADIFASYLLMPINDFRSQMSNTINLDSLSHCADRYGVSLTAAILKWLSYTSEKAVLVMSNDGFIKWGCASSQAQKAGAFFKTKTQTIEVPQGSLTANDQITTEYNGVKIPARAWFPHADSDAPIVEMKIYSEQYDCTLTLLLLPKYTNFWPPRNGDTIYSS